MKQRINIAELLKDCPKGMELDCMMFDDAKFINIEEDDKPICIRTGDTYRYLTKFGTWTFDDNAKCVIFPKGKTTWEGFQRPFKAGDIVSVLINKRLWYGIYEKESNDTLCCYVSYSTTTRSLYNTPHSSVCSIDSISEMRFATENEKQKLFDAIKANNYKWNPDTKTLEKLPKFKVGDEIVKRNSITNPWIVYSVNSEYYGLKLPNGYEGIGVLPVSEQDDWELVSNKFDISNLKAYDKVLVRDDNNSAWINTFFGFYDTVTNKKYPFIAGCVNWAQCIPYEENKHLLGTTDDCDDFYKNW